VKNLYSLFLLAAALFLSCVSIGFVDENNIDTCGGERYTSGSQICENNTLKNLCGMVYYDPKIKFCFEQNTKVYNKCDGEIYNPFDVNRICEDNILKIKCGEGYYNPQTQFCIRNNVLDKCGGKEYESSIYECEEGILLNKCRNEIFNSYTEYCADGIVMKKKEFIDTRDGKTYKYVYIGNQIWMAENLRYETPNSKCYDNDLNNCEIYGRLYNWNTAKTVCPSGWHLPGEDEWIILRGFVGWSDAGMKLKANDSLWNGTDDFGFTALPGGYCFDKNFERIEKETNFWTITEDESRDVYICYFTNDTEYFANDRMYFTSDTMGCPLSYYINNHWFSVRCVKDWQ